MARRGAWVGFLGLVVLGMGVAGGVMWWRRGLANDVLAEEIKSYVCMLLTASPVQGADLPYRNAMEVRELSINEGAKTFTAVFRLRRSGLNLGTPGFPLDGQDGFYEGKVSGEFGEVWITQPVASIPITRPHVVCRKLTFPEDAISSGGPSSEARWKKGDATANEIFDGWVNLSRFHDGRGSDLPRQVLYVFTMRHLRRTGKFDEVAWLRNYDPDLKEPWKSWAKEEVALLDARSRK
jgi:hypothetical protein